MSLFPTEFKETVRSRTDIVELIGQEIALTSTRGGAEFIGLCPFHDDTNPSLRVNPDRQSYKCWVCDEGGDCFSFMQRRYNVGFREALEMLAKAAGLEMPRGLQPSCQSRNNDSLYEVVAWAEEKFHRCLLESPHAELARLYLDERGVTEKSIEAYRLGYHPEEWQWLINLATDQFTQSQLLAARLIGEKSSGPGYRDNFVGRLMFPIRDERDRPVAFGGRVLPGSSDQNGPKYWNSPESEVFHKNRLIYGFTVARDSIRQERTAVVVEGYTDCIACHQHGLGNVVGTLGTALTENHVRALKRFAEKVVLIYDGDTAGQNAAERALTRFLEQEVDLRILTLPNNADPADFVEDHGVDALRERIQTAPEAWQYKLQVLQRKHPDSIDGRNRILEEMLQLIAVAPNASVSARKDMLLGLLAQQLGIAEATIRKRLGDIRSTNQRRRPRRRFDNDDTAFLDANAELANIELDDEPAEPMIPISARQLREEDEILEIIFSVPDTIEVIRQAIGPDDFRDPNRRRLLEVCCDLAEQGVSPSCDHVTAALEDAGLKRIAFSLEASRNEKGILNQVSDFHPTQNVPSFLSRALNHIQRRRDEHSHLVSKQHIAGQKQTSELDGDTIAQLRRLMEFHTQRATRKHNS